MRRLFQCAPLRVLHLRAIGGFGRCAPRVLASSRLANDICTNICTEVEHDNLKEPLRRSNWAALGCGPTRSPASQVFKVFDLRKGGAVERRLRRTEDQAVAAGTDCAGPGAEWVHVVRFVSATRLRRRWPRCNAPAGAYAAVCAARRGAGVSPRWRNRLAAVGERGVAQGCVFARQMWALWAEALCS